MSASRPLRQPCPPGACVCERERLEAPGADHRILLLTRQEEQRLAAAGSPAQHGRPGTPAAAHGGTTGHPPADRPAFGEVRSMRGIRILRAAGALPQDPPGDSRRHPPRPGEAPEVAYALLAPMTCCATPEGTERQERGCRSRPGRASGVSADNAHGVIRPTGRSGCRRAPGPPESMAGLATAPGFSSPTPPARRRTSPAGGAGRHRTGCAVRRGGCRRGFPCRAA